MLLASSGENQTNGEGPRGLPVSLCTPAPGTTIPGRLSATTAGGADSLQCNNK